MKAKIYSLLVALVSFADVEQAVSQLPVISSFSQNGLLVCSGLQTGSVASVEWASSLSGPWQTNWTGLTALTVGTNGTIQASVPMFYRVRGLVSSNNAAPSGMVLIPAGAFTMGNSIGDGDITDATPISVSVSAFYLDTNLVNWSKWQSVYYWATNRGYRFFTNTVYGVYQAAGKSTNHPVHTVNWFDCVKWCNARSQQEGLAPVYYTDAGLTQIYTNGEPTTIYPNWAPSGYRLPTEAEWEKAARGGLSGQRFPWGNTISRNLANYYGETSFSYDLGPNGYNPAYTGGGIPYTSPVGSYAANGYGLYDMAGNVFQWCWDWYTASYAGGADPRGPVGPLSNRVLRGGYWGGYVGYARCDNRSNYVPGNTLSGIGFRCVRGL